MKKVILTFSLALHFGISAQIKGVEKYTFWNSADTINNGVKSFAYFPDNPYTKTYWYSESFSKEDYDNITAELKRLLELNDQKITEPNSLSETLDPKSKFLDYNMLFCRTRLEKETFHYWWDMKDMHPEVQSDWVVEFTVNQSGFQIYAYSAYAFEIRKNASYKLATR